MSEITEKIKLFAFYLDGTVYLGENAIAGAVELIDYLRKKYQVVFFTNNSSKTRREISGKLNKMGIKCKSDEVYTSSFATALYLSEMGIDDLYVIGSDSFRSELKHQGLQITDNGSAKNLAVGFDSNFNYKKIATAVSILFKGGKFIACNEDGYFPVGENRYMPGCGAMVGAIVASAGKRPDFIVGKPNTYSLSKISKTFKVRHDEIMLVGDSYERDVVMALNYNSNAILIDPEANVRNESVLVLKDIHGLLQYMRRC